MDILILVIALILFYLVLWWQYKRDWKEDRLIAAWFESWLSRFGDWLFSIYDAIVGWCMGWEGW